MLLISDPRTLHTAGVLRGPAPDFITLLVHAGHLHDQRRVQIMVNMLAEDWLDIMDTFLTLKEEESQREQPGSLVHSDHLIQAVLACLLKDAQALGGPNSVQAPVPGMSPNTWRLIVCQRIVHCFCKPVRLTICDGCRVLFTTAFCGSQRLISSVY